MHQFPQLRQGRMCQVPSATLQARRRPLVSSCADSTRGPSTGIVANVVFVIAVMSVRVAIKCLSLCAEAWSMMDEGARETHLRHHLVGMADIGIDTSRARLWRKWDRVSAAGSVQISGRVCLCDGAGLARFPVHCRLAPSGACLRAKEDARPSWSSPRGWNAGA